MPSRKWFATQITAVSALLIMLVTTGAWGAEESVALIGLVSQASIAYLVPNTDPEEDPDELSEAPAGPSGA